MKHPEGAIKSILELKKVLVPGAVLWMVFEDPPVKFKVTPRVDTKISEDHANKCWRFAADTADSRDGEKYQNHSFWSPYGDLHFPTTADRCGFLFSNYWHAYAYELRCKKSA